jgi:hypothetical protein
MRSDMTIFVYLCSGLPERQDSKMSSVTGEGITCQRIGLADGARTDAIPNAAGGEAVTGPLNRMA